MVQFPIQFLWDIRLLHLYVLVYISRPITNNNNNINDNFYSEFSTIIDTSCDKSLLLSQNSKAAIRCPPINICN